MALLPTKQRDQILLIVIALSLGSIGAYYMYLYQDKAEQIASLEAHVASLDSLNERVKAEVKKGSVEKLKKEAKLYESDLVMLRQLVPSTNEVPALLEQVSTAARRAGLELSDVMPEGVQPGDQFDTYKYKIGVVGGFHAVAEFITNVGSLQRIVAPMNLTLVVTNGKGEKKARRQESLLDAKLDIQTYVSHGGPAPAAPPPTKAEGNP
jgi:type IV pilus assembly protein PilO